ncbi:clathrin interactor EPSIN 2-like isoform X2 [Magnolia sinica]|uniref:clathrin interactor EPSIN 2-like isoform X2 n=1 Tax=Magnolia sinica TaxID=86752 RepID=UPI00265B0A11|nr:clathrin interactor EPSIN 2-like isoform X2 [Magnolia sinica]
MKKAFGQTVRDLKREMNKKVLKVPGLEQKVLDTTSNEPWGPHGSHLVDIAQATRNYNEYQMIMAVLWKRVNDTGKNWRHVYKALAVLEYLVAHGSERVIDEIREHAYQISTLSDFQYIDSNGRDQGSNIRKKSQSLVLLVNDKERIQEVRQKALTNRDKGHHASSASRSSSHSSTGGYGDRHNDDCYEGRHGNKNDDRNRYGRERDRRNRDHDRYSRGGDPHGRGGDRYGRDSDDRYSRDSYRDDDSRSRSSYDDDRRFEHNLSEQNNDPPPSYEEAVGQAHSSAEDERDGDPVTTSPPPKASSPPGSTSQDQDTTVADVAASSPNKEVGAFGEFDPRASLSASTPAQSAAEMDLLHAFSDPVPSNALVPVLATLTATAAEPTAPVNSSLGPDCVPPSSASTVLNQLPLALDFKISSAQPQMQPYENPFGDSPFIATPSEDNFVPQPQNFAPMSSFQTPATSQGTLPLQPATPSVESVPNFDFGDTFQGMTYAPSDVAHVPPSTPEFLPPALPTAAQPVIDILDELFPPSGHTTPVSSNVTNVPLTSATPEFSPPQQPTAQNVPLPNAAPEFLHPQLPTAAQPGIDILGGLLPPSGSTAPPASQASLPARLDSQASPLAPIISQKSLPVPVASQASLPSPTGPPAMGQLPKQKFEPKSTVWADTLSRGLVDFNISGPKTNPLADIGIDFDSINRKEKRREEKSSATPVTSTITMGKAMGSGSGIGRAGATGLLPPPNPMMGTSMGMGMMGMGGGAGMGMGMGMGMGGGAGMGMGMGMGGGAGMGMGGGAGMGMGMGGGAGMGMGMGGYGGMNQPMGMNMGAPGMGMGMGMNMGMGQGAQMQPAAGIPPAPSMQGGYNPMMGIGGYAPQQPYGGYR